MQYEIVKKAAPCDCETWDGDYWQAVPAVNIDQFHPQSSDHHPAVQAKVTHSGDAIHLFFRVQDNYVRSVRTQLHEPVCRDSCVEFFVQPPNPAGAYFNFEINCGGTMLLFFVEDHSREGLGDLKKSTPVKPELCEQVKILHSMPEVVEPEITEPTEWTIRYTIPVSLFEEYLGQIAALDGQTWRANFYKCADETSKPHWASWAPVGEPLNFHKPECFAPITFGQ